VSIVASVLVLLRTGLQGAVFAVATAATAALHSISSIMVYGE
jgi:hypothetical protein